MHESSSFWQARIASSITSAGLGSAGLMMVARDWEDYYEIALRLATTPYVYEQTRHRLIRARATCALYNTEKWVREWQRGQHILKSHPYSDCV
jgi:predicted O-linked N-acetylglucosamine transferase (SPINDLY family)